MIQSMSKYKILKQMIICIENEQEWDNRKHQVTGEFPKVEDSIYLL